MPSMVDVNCMPAKVEVGCLPACRGAVSSCMSWWSVFLHVKMECLPACQDGVSSCMSSWRIFLHVAVECLFACQSGIVCYLPGMPPATAPQGSTCTLHVKQPFCALAARGCRCACGTQSLHTKPSHKDFTRVLPQECPTSGLLLAESIRSAPRPSQKAKSTEALKKVPVCVRLWQGGSTRPWKPMLWTCLGAVGDRGRGCPGNMCFGPAWKPLGTGEGGVWG
eukprot:364674-Chlamydomonas_euryale.AAC.3